MRRAVKLCAVQEVVEATGVSRRTLRIYEEVGLIAPAAREGNRRLYPEETIETVRRIQRLRRDLGVNLAGVQVILEMRSKIELLQQSLDEMVRFVREELKHELEQYLRRQEKAVVPKPLAHPPKPADED
ncbi:MAG: helix-turn-helix transcriptional regulator [Deferrisomatales bacterium]